MEYVAARQFAEEYIEFVCLWQDKALYSPVNLNSSLRLSVSG